MNRRTKSDWQALFNEHDQSGLTATAFCLERNLNPKYFSLRRKQLQTNETDKVTSPFAPVVVPTSNNAAMIELHHGEIFLKIPLSVSPAWLVHFLNQCQA